MLSFDQFWDLLNGELYQHTPPPVQYNLASYERQITNGSPLNNVEGGAGHQLRPIKDEDIARYAADDVSNYYSMWHGGNAPNRLGKEMTDDQFKKHMGHTW